MPRRFNPSETVRSFLQSSSIVTKPLKKSLKLFVGVLEDFRQDERFSTGTDIVKLKDNFEGKQVIWQLEVKKSIIQSLCHDKHISLTAISDQSGHHREKQVCVERKGNLPIGDYLAQFLLLFANGKHMDEIKTLETAAMRVTYPTRSYERIDPMAVYWQPFYEIVIAQQSSHEARLVQILALEPANLLYMIQRLFNLDLDFEPSITSEELQQLFLSTFERCDNIDVKRFIVARLDATEEALNRLEAHIRTNEIEDAQLLRAIDYAIRRMQN